MSTDGVSSKELYYSTVGLKLIYSIQLKSVVAYTIPLNIEYWENGRNGLLEAPGNMHIVWEFIAVDNPSRTADNVVIWESMLRRRLQHVQLNLNVLAHVEKPWRWENIVAMPHLLAICNSINLCTTSSPSKKNDERREIIWILRPMLPNTFNVLRL